MSAPERDADVVVIGAGVGGMIAACQLARAGRRVIVLENLSFVGGRFSAFTVGEAQVPSGAFHTFPHGAMGPLARALRRSGAHIRIASARVFASFHLGGRHVVVRHALGAPALFPRLADRWMLCRVPLQAWLQAAYPGSFGDWLASLGASRIVLALFDRFAQFALSTSMYHVPYAEGRKIIEMIIRYGLPGIPQGGAGEVARQLGRAARRAGVVLRKNARVEELLVEHGQVAGVVVFDRRRGRRYAVRAPTVISNTGPAHTTRLAHDAGLAPGPRVAPLAPPAPAVGLKIQVLSPRSLIEHDSIMFCLDTQRVAGVIQATNADPRLAPPGRHLLVSHQTIAPGADWQVERDLGLEDWRYLFGRAFADCQVLGVSHFPARFPVNWATQGHDLRTQPFAQAGLWMVGDGVKPPGLMMAEGVAASAEAVAHEVLRRRNGARRQGWGPQIISRVPRLPSPGGG